MDNNITEKEVIASEENGKAETPEEIVYSTEECFAIIEACLFAAGHPLTYAKLGDVLHLSVAETEKTVEQMAVLYNSDDSFPRGIMLVRFPDSCQLCTKEIYGVEIKNALGIRRGGKLSQSLLEVLAIIAYNQPTTRAFVDTVRGVDSSYPLSSLTEKNLIEQCGRLDAPGRPALYRTTTDFLRVFGLSELSELPTVRLRTDSGETIELQAGETDGEQLSISGAESPEEAGE